MGYAIAIGRYKNKIKKAREKFKEFEKDLCPECKEKMLQIMKELP
jgi:hypothetical protein